MGDANRKNTKKMKNKSEHIKRRVKHKRKKTVCDRGKKRKQFAKVFCFQETVRSGRAVAVELWRCPHPDGLPAPPPAPPPPPSSSRE